MVSEKAGKTARSPLWTTSRAVPQFKLGKLIEQGKGARPLSFMGRGFGMQPQGEYDYDPESGDLTPTDPELK
jgi:hypothetical protein